MHRSHDVEGTLATFCVTLTLRLTTYELVCAILVLIALSGKEGSDKPGQMYILTRALTAHLHKYGCTVKPVLSGHSKNRQNKDLNDKQ